MSADRFERQAYAYLSRVCEPPRWQLNDMLADFGARESFELIFHDRIPNRYRDLRGATEARRHVNRAEADLDEIDSIGGRLVTPLDDEWPGKPDDFLLNRGDDEARCDLGPIALWVRGQGSCAALLADSVGIVGTRDSSGYGNRVATDIAVNLAEVGITVLSGAAYGIDAAAHRAALAVAGPTVAIVAGGVDRPYPSGHQALFESIAAQGLVISEQPPGEFPARSRFLSRNRLIAGYSRTTVVIEAAARSGSLNTAAWAIKFAKVVAAVPGPVTSVGSVGTNSLIRDGRAVLVRSADDVRELATPDFDFAAPDPEKKQKRTDVLNPEQLAVYEGFPARGAIVTEALSASSGIPVARVRSLVVELELRGFAAAADGGWVRR